MRVFVGGVFVLLLMVGWLRLIEEDLAPHSVKLATFDNATMHTTEDALASFGQHGIETLCGPPNGTDLWQPNDQLINKHLRRGTVCISSR